MFSQEELPFIIPMILRSTTGNCDIHVSLYTLRVLCLSAYQEPILQIAYRLFVTSAKAHSKHVLKNDDFHC